MRTDVDTCAGAMSSLPRYWRGQRRPTRLIRLPESERPNEGAEGASQTYSNCSQASLIGLRQLRHVLVNVSPCISATRHPHHAPTRPRLGSRRARGTRKSTASDAIPVQEWTGAFHRISARRVLSVGQRNSQVEPDGELG
jgi:hypothetical protein